MQAHARGAIFKRYGSTQFLSEAAPAVELTSVGQAVIAGVKSLLVCGGGKIFAVSEAGKATEIGKGFNSEARWSILQAPVSHSVAGQGPIYLTNGVNAPQYWTGAGEVKAWTGITSNPKLTDGVVQERKLLNTLLRSKTAKFISTDTELEVKGEGIPVGARILAVLSTEEVELTVGEESEKEETKEKVTFEITRQYYPTTPNVPNGQYMIFVGNRVWMTGITADPSAVWFSELVSIGEAGEEGDPCVWPATNVVRFDSSDGYPVTGIGTCGPYVLVFKEYKTWAIHDLDTGANRKIADSVGCVAQNSIVESAIGTFFLTADQGVYLTNGSKMSEMSYKVRPTILAINESKRQHAAGFYYQDHYYLSYPTTDSAVNNRTLDYDVQLKAWWLQSLAANEWLVSGITGETAPYGLTPGVSKGVSRAFVPGIYTDLGQPYEGEYGLAAFWFGNWQVFSYYIFRHRVKTPFLKKRIRAIHFDGSGVITPIIAQNFYTPGLESAGVVGNLNQDKPELPVNFSADSQIFGNPDEEQLFGGEEYKGVTMIFGGTSAVQDARIYSPGIARAWSVGFGNADDEPFEVDSYTFFMQFRKS